MGGAICFLLRLLTGGLTFRKRLPRQKKAPCQCLTGRTRAERRTYGFPKLAVLPGGAAQPWFAPGPESRKTAQSKSPTSTAPLLTGRHRPELLASTVNIGIGRKKMTLVARKKRKRSRSRQIIDGKDLDRRVAGRQVYRGDRDRERFGAVLQPSGRRHELRPFCSGHRGPGLALGRHARDCWKTFPAGQQLLAGLKRGRHQRLHPQGVWPQVREWSGGRGRSAADLHLVHRT